MKTATTIGAAEAQQKSNNGCIKQQLEQQQHNKHQTTNASNKDGILIPIQGRWKTLNAW